MTTLFAGGTHTVTANFDGTGGVRDLRFAGPTQSIDLRCTDEATAATFLRDLALAWGFKLRVLGPTVSVTTDAPRAVSVTP